MPTSILSIDQLKRAIAIAEQIETLQVELNQILGGKVSSSPHALPVESDPRKGKRSPAIRAKMAAAQKARWAKSKTASAPSPMVAGKIARTEAAGLSAKPNALKAGPGKSIPLSELKILLETAPEKTLNVRKAGLQLRNIKILADANPQLLRLGGKNPWPTVTMLR